MWPQPDVDFDPKDHVVRQVFYESGGGTRLPMFVAHRRDVELGGDRPALQKQNVFDDFIAAAGWLIDHGCTRPEKLAVQGRSNGGLLVGAAMTRRPGLFGAALPAVGVRAGQIQCGNGMPSWPGSRSLRGRNGSGFSGFGVRKITHLQSSVYSPALGVLMPFGHPLMP
ncbi:MAG: prolyl oligopeptidase family serine peptidase [Rhodospirillaceae bacterium]|nr:prolyl oligopeptidase family serine peptidase [Rhodospirillaceae bacterium]